MKLLFQLLRSAQNVISDSQSDIKQHIYQLLLSSLLIPELSWFFPAYYNTQFLKNADENKDSLEYILFLHQQQDKPD